MKNLLLFIPILFLFSCGESVSISPYSGKWDITMLNSGDTGTATFTEDSLYINIKGDLFPCAYSLTKTDVTVSTPTIGALQFTETEKSNSQIVWNGKAGNPFISWTFKK
jgi:hypothetical protein